MWIAVLCSVKLFPNLEAALKGVFNSVLKFFPNASTRPAISYNWNFSAACQVRFLNASHFRHFRSHSECSSSSTTTTSSEPPPSPDSRPSFDGWLPKPRHDRRPRVKAHCLRAYQPAHPVKLSKMARKRAQQRWSGLFRRIAEHVRATLGDALWADSVSVARTPTRTTRTPS